MLLELYNSFLDYVSQIPQPDLPYSQAIAVEVIAAIISAVAAVAGGVTNAVTTNRTNRKNTADTNRLQKELQEDAQAYNTEMWNRTNEYNEPINQYARYADAGINPAAMFGGGSSTTASAVSSAIGSASNTPPSNGVDLSSLLQIVPAMLDVKRVQNETRIAKAQEKALTASAGLSETQSEGLKWDNEHKQEAFDNNQKLINAQIDNYVASTHKTKKETATLKENLKWLGKLNEKQIENLDSIINKTIAETNLVKAQTNTEYYKQVEASWRASCYKQNIDPDARGLDKVFNMLLTDPDSFVDVFSRIKSTLYDNDDAEPSLLDKTKSGAKNALDSAEKAAEKIVGKTKKSVKNTVNDSNPMLQVLKALVGLNGINQ